MHFQLQSPGFMYPPGSDDVEAGVVVGGLGCTITTSVSVPSIGYCAMAYWGTRQGRKTRPKYLINLFGAGVKKSIS